MSFWTSLRNIGETAGTLAANYYLPGSSLLTSHLVSHGSQNQLNSPLGILAQMGTGGAGAGVGQSFTSIPSATDMGAGWTNAINKLGGTFGSPTAGTDLSSRISGLFGSGGAAPSSAGNVGTFKYDWNGNPVGDSALPASEQFSSNLGLSDSSQGSNDSSKFGNIMKLLGSGGMGNNQQSNGQQPQISPAPTFTGGSGANMQNIYAHIRNMQQQMAQPLNTQNSLGSNISGSINPYFSGYRPY